MEKNYDEIIDARAGHVFDVMARTASPKDMDRLREAFALAREAHAPQRRKGGEPYILHPIAVAGIIAEDLNLGVNPVIAGFLHDVVEDTDIPLSEIQARFGDDVAFLVGVVTKAKGGKHSKSKQVDNYRQMLDSVQYDIRALLVKLADRLHNMRTLSAMAPAKQMKIAGETDYFYAPLANRLGLFHIKTELENLSFRFRCPQEYNQLTGLIERDRVAQSERLNEFARQIGETLDRAGIRADVIVEYRAPYSIWRKMRKQNVDFDHLNHRHFTEIVFDVPQGMTEKEMALRVYALLTSRFKELPGSVANYIDAPKENGYQSFHVKLLAHFGRWQEVHMSSRRMKRNSRLGCIAERSDRNIHRWIDRFRDVLKELSRSHLDDSSFIEKVVTTFYNDDIMTFTPEGRTVMLPQGSTVIDFAYEVGRLVGEKAKYARINGYLSSIKAPLRRGDVVEVFTADDVHPMSDWLEVAVSYKAKNAIKNYINSQAVPLFRSCSHCHPIPGEEVVGFKGNDNRVSLHKRDCEIVIKLASQHGDRIRSINFLPDETLYPERIAVRAVDRYHLFIDLVDCITNKLHLNMQSINTTTADNIVTSTISFGVHSFDELQSIIRHISTIPGVDEVKRL